MKKKFDARESIRQLALQEGITTKQVREEIKFAILVGSLNPDPEVQARWNKIPCKGDAPTPEELITYLVTHLHAGINPSA